MTLATLIMLALGIAFFAGGLVLLGLSRRGNDAARYVRRISGTMLAALGAALVIFAVGLSEPVHA